MKGLIIDKHEIIADFLKFMLDDDSIKHYTENQKEFMFFVSDDFDVDNFERQVMKIKEVITGRNKVVKEK